ncbi:aminotransferase class V-fold PLP-dependent enzyme [Lignipirellula cremea]|uniref:Probable cysteine desulfurase n=1 Tax=Lignipirellula cremea TaxID=2528010 RepID=A0A518DWG0_9BACT|nr:cysteine desulfurase [Lignipirellula cremea]QDU96163.1 putative cysteine desulfurase [Lignipirellula cremea]
MSVAPPAAAPPFDVAALRNDFPILQTCIHGDKPLVYLDNAATTQRPRQVIDTTVDMYERQYANVHRGVHWLSDQSTDLYEGARERVRAFINAEKSCEVIFTTGTTAAINTVARSWGDANVTSGDEILLTQMEHHSNIVPWQQLAERTGCRVRFLPITDDGRLDLAELPGMLNERTRMVALCAASNVLGTINPLEEIIAQAHSAGALVLVDAAQSAPHQTTDVQQLGADFLAFSGHKMLGPSGVGVLYGREALLDAMPPFLGGGSMIKEVSYDGFEPIGLPAKFEAGTPPIVPAIGLTAAIDYLAAIGLENIHHYEQQLASYAQQLIQDLPGLRLLGPEPSAKAGIVSFVMDSPHAHDVAQLLDREGIAIRAGHHCTMPLHSLLGIVASNRASFYFYNTREEVEKFAETLVGIREFFAPKHRKRKPRNPDA